MCSGAHSITDKEITISLSVIRQRDNWLSSCASKLRSCVTRSHEPSGRSELKRPVPTPRFPVEIHYFLTGYGVSWFSPSFNSKRLPRTECGKQIDMMMVEPPLLTPVLYSLHHFWGGFDDSIDSLWLPKGTFKPVGDDRSKTGRRLP